MAKDPKEAQRGQYVPKSKKVLHATRMVAPLSAESLRFIAPKEPGKYRATFTIKVKNGMTAKLEVSATATLREEDIDVVAADKHLRLMQLGEIS